MKTPEADAPDLSLWLEQGRQAIAIAYDMLAEATIVADDRKLRNPGILAATLLIRTVNNLRGTLALVEAGLCVEAQILARACIENAMWGAALAVKGDAFIDQMVADEAQSQKKRLDFVQKNWDVDDAEMSEVLAGIAESLLSIPVKAKFLQPGTVKDLSPYRVLYLIHSHLSACAAHPSIAALTQYIEADGTSWISGLNGAGTSPPADLARAAHYAILGLEGMCVAFNQQCGSMPSGGERLTRAAAAHLALGQQCGFA